jgi:hypothetical protein
VAGRVYRWAVPIKPDEPGYVPMREAIRRALIEQDTNPNAVAEEAGLNKFYVYNYLTAENAALEAKKLAKVLKALKLPADGSVEEAPRTSPAPARRKSVGVQRTTPLALVGVIELGSWRDPKSAEPSGISACPNWPAEGQRVFQIGAVGIPKLASPGDYLIVLTNDPPIVEGCFVVMSRERDGLVEFGLYQAHAARDKIELHPTSARGNLPPRVLTRGKLHDVVGVVIEVVKSRDGETYN